MRSMGARPGFCAPTTPRRSDGGCLHNGNSGRLCVRAVDTIGDVSLETQPGPGSILDAGNDLAADIIGNTIDLKANGSSIGQAANDLDIDSQAYAQGTVGLEASASIYLNEADGNVRFVLAHTYTGDIR